MKIAVVTFWSNHENYGSQLQCYALQQYLANRGHEVSLIRWTPDYSKVNICKRHNSPFRYFRIFNPFRCWRYLSGKLLALRSQRLNQLYPREFDRFRAQYIKMTRVYSSILDLRQDPPPADVYISGSDQVWNWYYISEEAKGNFLDFGPRQVRRVAFAASIGVSKDSEQFYAFTRPLLAKFDGISVREKSGIRICQRSGGADVVQVCDPTLLVDQSYYASLAKKSRVDFTPDVLCYFLNIAAKADVDWGLIARYLKRTGKTYKIIPAQGAERFFSEKELVIPNMESFLKLYQAAKMVITNSFHGVVFSIVFHKTFVYIPQRGNTEGQNSRVLDLLNDLSLNDRVFTGRSDFSSFEQAIDWAAVECKRLRLQRNADSFLESVGL